MEKHEPRRAKRHHFIAQVHLRQFAIAENPRQLWLFDKETGEYALTALENAAVRADYYTVTTAAGKDDHVERMFAQLEDNGARAMDTLRSGFTGFPVALPPTQREALAMYVALQFTRVPSQRERFRSLANFMSTVDADIMLGNRVEFLRRMRARGATESDADLNRQRIEWLRDFRSGKLTLQHPEEVELMPMLQGAIVIQNALRAFSWWVFKRFEPIQFVIGDSPVALWSNQVRPGMGIGFNTLGVEVTMPIAPDSLLIGMAALPVERVFALTDSEHVHEHNRRTLAASSRFVYAARKEDLVALSERYGDTYARATPDSFDAHIGPREWRDYAKAARWRPPKKRNERRSRGSRANRHPDQP